MLLQEVIEAENLARFKKELGIYRLVSYSAHFTCGAFIGITRICRVITSNDNPHFGKNTKLISNY